MLGWGLPRLLPPGMHKQRLLQLGRVGWRACRRASQPRLLFRRGSSSIRTRQQRRRTSMRGGRSRSQCRHSPLDWLQPIICWWACWTRQFRPWQPLSRPRPRRPQHPAASRRCRRAPRPSPRRPPPPVPAARPAASCRRRRRKRSLGGSSTRRRSSTVPGMLTPRLSPRRLTQVCRGLGVVGLHVGLAGRPTACSCACACSPACACMLLSLGTQQGGRPHTARLLACMSACAPLSGFCLRR